MKKLWALATADWHATLKCPPCRSDDLRQTLVHKLDIIAAKSMAAKVPVIAAGDLLNSSGESYETSSLVHQITSNMYRLWYVYGQHDLVNQNLKEAKRGATHFLASVSKLWHQLTATPTKHDEIEITGCSWGENPVKQKSLAVRVLVIHKSVWCQGVEASKYYGVKPRNSVEHLVTLPEYSQFDLIISGDNHSGFIHRCKSKNATGRTLWLNCGPILRLKANETTPPYYYEVYTDDTPGKNFFTVVPKELPHAELTREHIDNPKMEEALLSRFVKAMKRGTKQVSFEEVLKALLEDEVVSSRVKELTWEIYERAKSSKR